MIYVGAYNDVERTATTNMPEVLYHPRHKLGESFCGHKSTCGGHFVIQ